MIFFILALAHAMGIQEMVVRDTEDALEREALEEISSNHLNTKRMDLAHHNATGHYYDKYSHIRTQNVVLHGCTSCASSSGTMMSDVSIIYAFLQRWYTRCTAASSSRSSILSLQCYSSTEYSR